MVLTAIVLLFSAGGLTYYFYDQRQEYFQMALVSFLAVFMVAILVLTHEYQMLGELYYPQFYWALFSFPLILFSRYRWVCLIWSLVYFVTLVYWLPDQDWFRRNASIIPLRFLVIYLTPASIGLLYLLSLYFRASRAYQSALLITLNLSLLVCFVLIISNYYLYWHMPLGQLGELIIFVIATILTAATIICFLNFLSFKQKVYLNITLMTLLILLMSMNQVMGLPIVIIKLTLLLSTLSLSLLYADKNMMFTTDVYFMLIGLQCSLFITSLFHPPYLLWVYNLPALLLTVICFCLYVIFVRRHLK